MTRIKQKTAHIRKILKREGINARVRMSPAGDSIQIITTAYGVHFSSEEIRVIATIAMCNGLTKSRRTPIDVANEMMLTGANQFNYEYHSDLDREAALV